MAACLFVPQMALLMLAVGGPSPGRCCACRLGHCTAGPPCRARPARPPRLGTCTRCRWPRGFQPRRCGSSPPSGPASGPLRPNSRPRGMGTLGCLPRNALQCTKDLTAFYYKAFLRNCKAFCLYCKQISSQFQSILFVLQRFFLKLRKKSVCITMPLTR